MRFWLTTKTSDDGRPLWVGAAIFDQRVGLSRTTGQVTHKTAPDIDTERDKLFADLEQSGELMESFSVSDFHQIRSGKNGGGDPWHTDGALKGGVARRQE